MLQKILRFFQKPRAIDAQDLLGFSIDTPEALDLLWHGYSQSKDPSIVRRIISVLDRKDAVRDYLHVWLNSLPKNESAEKTVRDLVERYHFPIDVDSRQIHGPLDLDIYVARVVQAGALKFADLPFTIPPADLLHLAMKSAALWSVTSMAEQDPLVFKICQEEATHSGGSARPWLSTVESERDNHS